MSCAQPEHLVIRADAGARMGAGHVMRCLSLAQEWLAQGGQVTFLTDAGHAALRQRLMDEGCQVVTIERRHPHPSDWLATKETLVERPDAAVVLDGYHFDAGYQRRVMQSGHRLLVIDDMAHLEHYPADLVLNQSMHADRLHYSCEPTTRLLLGTKYALLRNEFLTWRDWRRETPDVARKVLVTLGGGDQDNVTLKVIAAVRQLNNPDLEVVVVAGACNPHRASLQAAAQGAVAPIRVVYNATDMARLMAWADLAVAAAGSSCWELCYLGVPALLVVLAENQRPVAEAVAAAGAMINAGWHEALEPEGLAAALQGLLSAAGRRCRLSEAGRRLVRGDGRTLVVRELLAGQLTLRAAREEDCRLMWEWVNEADVRKSSFQTEAISWEDHVRWYSAKLHDPDCRIALAFSGDGEPVGQIRFEIKGAEAVVSVSVSAAHRRRGYGSQLVERGLRWLLATFPRVTLVHAYVKPDNRASLRAFGKAGFSSRGEEIVGEGVPGVHLVRGTPASAALERR